MGTTLNLQIMKKIIILLILIAFKINAQTITPLENARNFFLSQTSNGRYFKDINSHLDKFLGQWVYETAIDKVEITILKRANYDSGGGYTIDDLVIQCKYTKNGTIEFNTHLPNSVNKIAGGYFREPSNINRYRFLYYEPDFIPLNRYYLNIDYLGVNGAGLPQLQWATYFNLVEVEPNTARLPLNMVFTKVL